VVAFEDRNIILTGFMGTGKSTVGRELAAVLGFQWVDTDRLIEQRHGPIPEIFNRSGEEAFREIEREIAAEVASAARQVVSTGGRMLLDPDNIRPLSHSGRIFCLTADADVLIERLRRSPTPRPLLAGPDPEERVRVLLTEREPGYARFTAVDSGVRLPRSVVDDLVELVTTPTETATGRRGHAVLGDATFGLAPPVTVFTDENLAPLHGPLLGPVDRVTSDPDAVHEGSVVLLGGTSVTSLVDETRAATTCVVCPTTRAAMDRSYPSGVRVVVDLATLQTLGAEASGR
jgi:shikimate kinase